MHCRACDIPLTEREEKPRKVYLKKPDGSSEVLHVDACMCSRCWNTEQHDQVHEYKLGDHLPRSFFSTGED